MNSYTLDMARCDDTTTATTSAWLRSLASAVVLLRWHVSLRVLAHLVVHLADVLAHLRHGRTAVLVPSRTGGADYSARAVVTGRSPMCRLGGGFTDGSECSAPPRWRVAVSRTVLTARGWVSYRRWRLASSPAGLCDEYRVARGHRA